MTLTLSAPAAAPVAPASTSTDVDWTESFDVMPPVWMGRYRGVFIGMVEHREPEGYTAITHRGRNLGNFESLEDAQRSFYKV